jgi:hypothetical protein
MSDEGLIQAGRSDKYGQVHVERVGNTGFDDHEEPMALLRAQDDYALAAMLTYLNYMEEDPDIPEAQRESVRRQVTAFTDWRRENRDKIRLPGTVTN